MRNSPYFRRRISRKKHTQKTSRLGLEALENRELLAADFGQFAVEPNDALAPVGHPDAQVATQTVEPENRVRVIVELEQKGASSSVIQAANSRYASNIRELSELPIVILEIPESELSELSGIEGVKHVTRDVASPPTLASTLPRINGDDVHAMGLTGGDASSRQAVVVVDTGIDANHNFFRDTNGNSRIVAQRCFFIASGSRRVLPVSQRPNDRHQCSCRYRELHPVLVPEYLRSWDARCGNRRRKFRSRFLQHNRSGCRPQCEHYRDAGLHSI